MVVVETDYILALSSPADERHNEAVRILRRRAGELKLSPYTLIELDLLIRSGRIEVIMPDYYVGLSQLLKFYNIKVVEPDPEHLPIAWRLRSEHGLSYFDSLHAAVAIATRDAIASYDEAYRRVKGLRCIHPSQLG